KLAVQSQAPVGGIPPGLVAPGMLLFPQHAKIDAHLFGWNPDARFMDYYERNLFNHRLGTIEAGTGLSQYFLALTPGSYRIMGGEDDTFWCCNGSAVEEFNKLSDTIYFHDGRNVWVNLFLDSSLDWND